MPNIENLEKKPFKDNRTILNVRRGEILYREDIKTSFGYAIAGFTITMSAPSSISINTSLMASVRLA